MKVDKTNNLSVYQKNRINYTLAGISTGAIIGGTFGYLQKPWIKNDNITDTFASNIDKEVNKQELKAMETYTKELIKVFQTGFIDDISEDTMSEFEGIENGSIRTIRARAKELLDHFCNVSDTDNYKDIVKSLKEFVPKSSYEQKLKKIKELKALKITDNISVDEIVEFYDKKIPNLYLQLDEGESHREFIETKIKVNGKHKVIEDLKLEIKDQIEDYEEAIDFHKEKINSKINFTTKKIKKIEGITDPDEKILYNAIKTTIKDMDIKNSSKYAGIGALLLGFAGFGISFLKNKTEIN